MDDTISRQDAYDTLTKYYHHRTQAQHDALRDALSRVPSVEPEKRTEKRTETHACDLISREAVYNLLRRECSTAVENYLVYKIRQLPSAQPEPAIPLRWIEAQIEWMTSLDNPFLALTAGQLSAMVKKWKEEQAIEATLSAIDSNCESVVGRRMAIRDVLNRTPEAVVRCKDCKHYKWEATRCLIFNAPTREDGFCSHGKRRTNETN